MAINIVNERLVTAWNNKYPKDTKVRYYCDSNDPEYYEIAFTRSKAMLTWLPYPVVSLTNHVRPVNLLKVEPIENDSKT